MEIKKSSKVDLQNKRTLFLEIGLLTSLMLVIVMFSCSQKEKSIMSLTKDEGPIMQELIDITVQVQKPPEPVKTTITVISDIINVVKDNTKIATEFSFAEFETADITVQKAAVKEEVIESDEPFIIAEEMPQFMGGDLNKFRSWVQERLRYPTIAAENGIQGTVTLSFVVERDGTLTSISVLQTPDRSLSEEATRVLQTSPKWTPGKQRSTPVRIKYTLPVQFKLQDS